MRFDSFDEVVSWYERTKPIISKNHTVANDVRPIGARRRKWERIKKIDDNTYALCDGMYGNLIWGSQYPRMGEFENLMAAIVWTREADGDYVRIRNNNVNSNSVSRYNFLKWNLPRGMNFNYNNQGQHWITARTRGSGAATCDWEHFMLPKTDTRYDWNNQTIANVDEVYLKFRVNPDGTFTRTSAPLKIKTKRVDREAKKVIAAEIEAFYQYMLTMAPLLGKGWEVNKTYLAQLREYTTLLTVPGTTAPYWSTVLSVPPSVAKLIVCDPEHDLYPALAATVAIHTDFHTLAVDGDVRRIRAAYVRTINKLLGFHKIEEK